MVRYWLCTGVCFAAIGVARGGEPGPVPAPPTAAASTEAVPGAAVSKCSATVPVADAKPAAAISGRKQIEALLAKPAGLDFGGRETITVKELLDKLRGAQHHLSIRFDMPTLAGMYGEKQDGEPKATTNPLAALTEPLSNALPMRIREANHSQTVEAPSEAAPAPAPPASGPEAGVPAAGASYPPASTAPAAATNSVAPSNYPTTSAPAGSLYAPYPSGYGPAAGYPATSPYSANGSSAYGSTVYGGTAAPPAAAAGTTAPAALPVPAATPATAPASPVVAPAAPAPALNSATAAPAPVTRTAATVDAVPVVPQLQSVMTKPYPTTSAPPLLAPPSQVPAAPRPSDSGPIPAPPTIVVSHPVFAPLAAAAAAQATSDAKVEIPEPLVAKAAFAALSEVFPQGSQFAPIPQAVPQVQPESDPPCHEPTPSPQRLMDDLLNCEVDIRTIDLKTVSVATALRHALDSLPTVNLLGDGEGSPIMVSNCTLIDYLVEADGVQITTRLKALTYKETRVYSLKKLKDVTPVQMAAVIRQSIRPWSWRSRIDEMGEQLRGDGATAKAIGSLIKPTIQEGALEAAASTGISLNAAAPAAKTDDKKPGEMSDADQAAMFGNAIVNCVVTYAHTMLTGLEIVHYADPPTGSIQTLPGKLIITQSQAAHREIAELLEQLSEE